MTDRTITLIRHGLTAGNLRKAYIGVTDEPLCPEGREQIAGNTYPLADMVFSSPLIRCIQTAQIIYPDISPIIIQELRETDFGLFEGKNYKDLSDSPEYQRWIDSGGELPFPQGESREEADNRALAGFEKVLELSQGAERVSVVLHGGTIMAILSHYFKGDYYSYRIGNGEGYVFNYSHDGIYSGLHSGFISG